MIFRKCSSPVSPLAVALVSAATLIGAAGLDLNGISETAQAAEDQTGQSDSETSHRRGTVQKPVLKSASDSQPAIISETVFARHLLRALSLDPEYISLQAEVLAVDARHATTSIPIAGSPSVGIGGRMDTRGPRKVWQTDVEFGAPLWLPGQRQAFGQQVDADLLQAERRATERALQLAGELREAWWDAVLAMLNVHVAEQRLETAQAIQKDVERRAHFGDLSAQDTLFGENETLAADLDLSRARMEAERLRSVYSTITGGDEPLVASEPVATGRKLDDHPLIQLALAGIEAARAQIRYVNTTLRENPEVSLYSSQQGGTMSEEGTSFGFRLRVPLATEARNIPRRAAAQAGLTRATVEWTQHRRVLGLTIRRAENVLERAKISAGIARDRLDVARKQLASARLSFEAGETTLYNLYQVRRLLSDALEADARAEVELGRARARLNQAMGVLPGLSAAMVTPVVAHQKLPEPSPSSR
ncbi:Cobalt-zinc-cadmium resistance protein czcC [Granulibacter bethesdensis]|uniref:Cobalt-zinc-cadmium resistance protein czcC n=1 Tax=Granulibacter bethesdensis TaxID=364410 RepID=A0AAC9KC10_9PROT|nr:TolC family protein [Granulibacter bethesdensis]APH54568.1 Cobalt-zinc-cadmium resistance protein czcC [Granulibacter bethesdensis]APH62154.1 Cobalt-zinc-cadmium resistance protein czcC [Granulibacter bethesdensis]